MEFIFGDMQISYGSILAVSAALCLAYFCLSITLDYLSGSSRYLCGQPWVGLKANWFSKSRASIASLTNTKDMIAEGYDRFSKHNKLFALPQFATQTFVILPPSKIREVLQKSDDEVDLRVVLKDTVASYWTGDNDIAGGGLHLDVIRHQLTRNLQLFTSDIHSELVKGFEDQWKVNKDDWITVDALQTCMKIVSRAANRIFSGKDLCRNDDYLDHIRLYTQGVFTAAALINTMPSWLRPVVAPPMVSWNRRHLTICKKLAIPEIKRRIERIQKGEKSEDAKDALHWVIENAIDTGDPEEISPDKLCRRLIRLNMVAIHTTSITITSTLLDLFSCPRAEEFVEGLREECHRVLEKHGGQWTKAAVNDLIRVDSTIKESMRVSSLTLIGVMREVIKEDGIDLGDGLHIPKGVRVGAPNFAIHQDPKYYPNPHDFDAFRFARSREEFDEKGQVLQKKNQAIVTTGESFIAFGHGRHACPGRFFVSQEMKLMLAHIVMHYDVKLPGLRPPNLCIKANSIPPPGAKLMVRLRQ